MNCHLTKTVSLGPFPVMYNDHGIRLRFGEVRNATRFGVEISCGQSFLGRGIRGRAVAEVPSAGDHNGGADRRGGNEPWILVFAGTALCESYRGRSASGPPRSRWYECRRPPKCLPPIARRHRVDPHSA